MAAVAVSSAGDRQHNALWKWLLLTACALGALWLALTWYAWFGFGGRPWTGFWDGDRPGPTGDPFVVAFDRPAAGGASARAGIREGDRADLREQSWAGRVLLVTQPTPAQSTKLTLHRGSKTFATHITGSTVYEGDTAGKVWEFVPGLLLGFWAFACAMLIAIRRSWSLDGRVLTLILICLALMNVPFYPVDPTLRTFTAALGTEGFVCIAFFLLVYLASQFGNHPTWRRLIELAAYGVTAIKVLLLAIYWTGFATLRFDPFHNYLGSAADAIAYAPTIAITMAAVAAVATVPPQQRPRAGWLLLPIPLMFLSFYSILHVLAPHLGEGWFAEASLNFLLNAVWFVMALLVTYALLNRRVLDLGFVLSRTIVVSIVGLIVLIAFVLLEWILGSVLAGVSHATGLIANAALALVIGVSLNYVHKRVDRSVDLVLFRKRHEDEQALLAFSKEAAYVTEWDVLLDATIEKVRRHTDAQNAALLIGANRSYTSVRSFGDGAVTSISENDDAILALKTWHKPIDPHRYDTTIRAALVLPMLARGRLYGALLLGERAGGEAYAPDEAEALAQLANGVGSALEALSLTADGSAAALPNYVAGLHHAIASLGERIVSEVASRIDALRSSSPT